MSLLMHQLEARRNPVTWEKLQNNIWLSEEPVSDFKDKTSHNFMSFNFLFMSSGQAVAELLDWDLFLVQGLGMTSNSFSAD